MVLSNDLISQFVKTTNDTQDTKNETVVYGTIQEDTRYVKIDGSDILTPISTTTVLGEGDRVTVMIKNHTAIVTGNLSSPSARVIDTITIEELNATNAEIDKLKVVDVEIQETLTTKYLTAEQIDAEYARIDDLDARYITTEELEADYIKADEIDANYAKISTLESTYATIEGLDAIKGDITTLNSEVANIDTLIFGSATGDVIQTSFSNSVIAQLGDAQIKSAMIESVSADKITAGDIITNNVRVMSEDGSLIISDETLQISDGTRVRVQIGKDAASDYSINIWDQNGNLMFSKGGITDAAIKEAIIRNDMVSDTANIHASKLDIDSLFEEINDSSNTIKSTKVYLDDEAQTLDVAFKTLTTDVDSQGDAISSQGTAISTIQGQISSKIWQQDIDTVTDEMTSQYSTLAQNLDSFQTTVSSTYATKTELSDLEIGGVNLLVNTVDLDKWTRSQSDTSVGGSVVSFPVYSALYWRNINNRDLAIPYKSIRNRTLTFSFEVKSADYESINASTNVDEGLTVSYQLFPATWTARNVYKDVNYHSLTLSNEWQKIVYTFDLTDSFFTNPATPEQAIDVETDGFVIGVYNHTIYSMDIRNMQLEFGDKATDYSPSPEDLAMADDLEALTTRVSSAETTITQNTEAIELRAKQTDVDATFQNYYTITETEAAIKTSSDAITSSVSATYATISDLNSTEAKIGQGANILLNGNPSSATSWLCRDTLVAYAEDDSGDGYFAFQQHTATESSTHTDALQQNITDRTRFASYAREFKVVFDARDTSGGEQAGQIHIFLTTITEDGATTTWPSVKFNTSVFAEDWATYSGTISVDANRWLERLGVALYSSTPFDMRNIYLEEITDMAALNTRVTSAESSITQLSDKITANVTETTNLGTRMTTVEQTAEDLTVEVGNAAKTATDYLNFSDEGLVVGDMTADTLGKNVLIDSDSVDIRNGTTTLASFGANEVVLGQNDENSVINLCGGAGRISANTASASTSYPYRDALMIESKEIELESVYCTITATNEYESDTEPDVTRMAQLYAFRSSSSDNVSNIRIVAEHTDNSANTYVKTGFSALTYDASSSTRALMYAYDSGNQVYNSLNLYTDKATLAKPLYIDGVEFSGSNKVLWSGAYYMNASQTATLSEAISDQANGIVLVWSYYVDGAADNSNFNTTFVPKYFVSAHNGKGISSFLTNGALSTVAGKYLYISDTSITGYSYNAVDEAERATGLTTTPKSFVLRYVIGV